MCVTESVCWCFFWVAVGISGAALGDWAPLTTTPPPGTHQACRGFRHLDQCEHQIGPQETKFQLFNSAPEPLFLCNCTRR